MALIAILASAVVIGPTLARAVASPRSAPRAVRVLRVDGAEIGYRDINPAARGTPLLPIVGYGATMGEWDPALVRGLVRTGG